MLYRYIFISALFFISCQSHNKEARIVNGLKYYEEATFEGLLTALDHDSVESYLESRSGSFELSSVGRVYFPVSISRFGGQLLYTKEARKISEQAYPSLLFTSDALGKEHLAYQRPVYFATFKNFIDSLASIHTIKSSRDMDDSLSENIWVEFVVNKPSWHVSLGLANQKIKMFFVSLPDSVK